MSEKCQKRPVAKNEDTIVVPYFEGNNNILDLKLESSFAPTRRRLRPHAFLFNNVQYLHVYYHPLKFVGLFVKHLLYFSNNSIFP